MNFFDYKRIAKYTKMAESLTKKIEDKRCPMTQNPTPKRTCQYRSRLHDANNLERAQKAMIALARAIDGGKEHPILDGITKSIIETYTRKGLKGGEYYDVIPADDYSNSSPAALVLRSLMEQSETTEDKAIKIEREKAQSIEDAIDKVRFVKIPGFFPTPKPVIDKMLDLADIYAGMSILEPSAGMGDIAEALKSFGHNPDVIEIRHSLREILKMKDFNIVGEGFLEYTRKAYDRIIMNPPFEKGQDIEHVVHAYNLLKSGGRLVAIMSEGTFSNSQRKFQDFRAWLGDVGYSEKLEQGSFTGKDSFRQTGAATRIVVIDKN